MDCLLIAGGIVGPEDPLYELAPDQPKTLIEVGGKPMGQWVVDALTGAEAVERIVVLGLSAEHGLVSPKIVGHIPDQGALFLNALAGVEWLRAHHAALPRHVLSCCADIPLLTSAMVDELVARCPDPAIDVYYSAVPREAMERRFPSSARSFIHLADADVAGGDVHIISPQLADTHQELLTNMVQRRKSAVHLARKLGPAFLMKLAARRMSIAEAERKIAAKFNLQFRAVLTEHAEMAMDVDKPHQWELCDRELGR